MEAAEAAKHCNRSVATMLRSSWRKACSNWSTIYGISFGYGGFYFVEWHHIPPPKTKSQPTAPPQKNRCKHRTYLFKEKQNVFYSMFIVCSPAASWPPGRPPAVPWTDGVPVSEYTSIPVCRYTGTSIPCSIYQYTGIPANWYSDIPDYRYTAIPVERYTRIAVYQYSSGIYMDITV